MGVRFLESFITKILDQGCFTVDMLEEISKYKETKGQRPLIVVDLIGFSHAWLDPQEILFGVRVKPLIAKAREFFSKLREAGARITFIKDCRLNSDASATQWISRNNAKYQDQLKLIDAIANETPVQNLVNDVLPKLMFGQMTLTTVLETMTKGLGVFIHVTGNFEYDLVVSSYAIDNNAMAVLANDTDYLIHEGDWRYWSISKISTTKMTTLEYDKKGLRHALRLTAEQMPLFATLSGNSYVMYDDVFNFHQELGRKYKRKDRSMNIAEYVRKYLMVSADLSDKEVQYLVKEVYAGKDDWETHVEQFQASLDSYNRKKYLDQKMTVEREPFIQKLLDTEHNYVAIILEGIVARVSVIFDDLRIYKYPETTIKPVAALDIEIRKREMGIILQHQKKDGVTINRTIHTKLTHDEPYGLIECPPIYPDFTVPDLERLIFRKENDELDDIRFKLFQWVFNYAFVAKDLMKLQREFIPLLAALAFLIQEFDMTVEMADIFTCAYYDGFVDRVPNELEAPPVMSPIAHRMMYALVKIYTAAFRTLKVVGLKSFIEPSILDGVYFHCLHQKWQNMEAEKKQLKLKEIKDLRAIYTKNAENWW